MARAGETCVERRRELYRIDRMGGLVGGCHVDTHATPVAKTCIGGEWRTRRWPSYVVVVNRKVYFDAWRRESELSPNPGIVLGVIFMRYARQMQSPGSVSTSRIAKSRAATFGSPMTSRFRNVPPCALLTLPNVTEFRAIGYAADAIPMGGEIPEGALRT